MRRSPFTIIELIIVILIATVVVGMSMSVFYKLAAGNDVPRAAGALDAQISRARHQAMARRRTVALIMPGANSGLANDKIYGCFRLAYVTDDDGDGVYDWDSWVEGSQWHSTGKNCAILEADDDFGVADGATLEKEPVHNGYTAVNGVDLTSVDENAGNDVDSIRALIFVRSGRIYGSTNYITVGEAHYLAGRWIIKNPETVRTDVNKSSRNQVTLEVNKFSGLVTYHGFKE